MNSIRWRKQEGVPFEKVPVLLHRFTHPLNRPGFVAFTGKHISHLRMPKLTSTLMTIQRQVSIDEQVPVKQAFQKALMKQRSQTLICLQSAASFCVCFAKALARDRVALPI